MTKVAFHTLGCKVNHYESEAMMDLFKKRFYSIVNFDEMADVYIVNSCTVTNEAARKSRQLARKAKRMNPDAVVALVGCYTQVSPEEVKNISGVDIVIGSSHRNKIVDFIEDYKKNEEDFNINIMAREELSDYEDLHIESLRETTRAYVKIEEGCNQFCSYCIIPYARGPVRSRPVTSIINEVSQLVAKGVKEIILTGTHLGAYGYDWQDEESLENLLINLVEINGLEHIRLSSIEITEISDKLLDIIAKERKLCPHLHIPLQSGTNEILEKMNRPYTIEVYKEILEKIRKKISDIAITTDIIVGFPGERPEIFEKHYKFVEEMAFSRLHVFPFSIREGTPAAKMKGQVSGKVKKEYSRKLRELNKELMLDYQKKYLSKKRKMIVEEKRDNETNYLTGMTDNYIKVLLDEDDKYMGQLIEIELLKTYDYEKVIARISN
ncbi:tRNA (N(6)-L-threonylcarbamoyladenosine(37)-C(2))-methylthiotransferase MtaB [Natronospora cellulosivora (SeqCode)]